MCRKSTIKRLILLIVSIICSNIAFSQYHVNDVKKIIVNDANTVNYDNANVLTFEIILKDSVFELRYYEKVSFKVFKNKYLKSRKDSIDELVSKMNEANKDSLNQIKRNLLEVNRADYKKYIDTVAFKKLKVIDINLVRELINSLQDTLQTVSDDEGDFETPNYYPYIDLIVCFKDGKEIAIFNDSQSDIIKYWEVRNRKEKLFLGNQINSFLYEILPDFSHNRHRLIDVWK